MTYDLTKHIPRCQRAAVAAGNDAPFYRLNKPDYDRLPLDTFLVETMMGTGGRLPVRCSRIVRPNKPGAYERDKLTDGRRLLYVYWLRAASNEGRAVRMLRENKGDVYRHVVLPDDPRHALMVAFKLACDMKWAWKGGWHMPDGVLIRALGVEPLDPDVGYNFTENAR